MLARQEAARQEIRGDCQFPDSMGLPVNSIEIPCLAFTLYLLSVYSELLTHGQKWQTPVDGGIGEAEEHCEPKGDHDAHADGADASPSELSPL